MQVNYSTLRRLGSQKPKLALPSPETATKDERDVSVPTGLNINRDNIENQDRRPIIVRNDGKPFPTQAQAEKLLR